MPIHPVARAVSIKMAYVETQIENQIIGIIKKIAESLLNQENRAQQNRLELPRALLFPPSSIITLDEGRPGQQELINFFKSLEKNIEEIEELIKNCPGDLIELLHDLKILYERKMLTKGVAKTFLRLNKDFSKTLFNCLISSGKLSLLDEKFYNFIENSPYFIDLIALLSKLNEKKILTESTFKTLIKNAKNHQKNTGLKSIISILNLLDKKNTLNKENISKSLSNQIWIEEIDTILQILENKNILDNNLLNIILGTSETPLGTSVPDLIENLLITVAGNNTLTDSIISMIQKEEWDQLENIKDAIELLTTAQLNSDKNISFLIASPPRDSFLDQLITLESAGILTELNFKLLYGINEFITQQESDQLSINLENLANNEILDQETFTLLISAWMA